MLRYLMAPTLPVNSRASLPSRVCQSSTARRGQTWTLGPNTRGMDGASLHRRSLRSFSNFVCKLHTLESVVLSDAVLYRTSGANLPLPIPETAPFRSPSQLIHLPTQPDHRRPMLPPVRRPAKPRNMRCFWHPLHPIRARRQGASSGELRAPLRRLLFAGCSVQAAPGVLLFCLPTSSNANPKKQGPIQIEHKQNRQKH